MKLLGNWQLQVAFVFLLAVSAASVFVLKTLTDLSGTMIFVIATAVVAAAFGLYTLIVVKLGY